MESKKAYQILTSIYNEYIELVFSGKIASHDISEIQKEIQSIRESKGNKLLLDVRLLTERSIDTLYHVRRPENATGKIALVDLPENEYMKSRCEDIAKNTLMELKWFSDIDAAKAWLKSKEESTQHFHL